MPARAAQQGVGQHYQPGSGGDELNKVPGSWAGATVLVGAALFVTTVVTLHLVQPGYEPSQQLMSELALGPFGSAMIIAFAGLALAVFGVQVSIANFGAPLWFRLLLAVTAVFFLAAGMFPLGATSAIHITAIAIAFVLSVLAMYFFPSCAGHAASMAPRSISWSLAAGVAASVVLGHSVLPMGVGQRLAALCLIVWLVVLGWRLGRMQPTRKRAADLER